MTTLPGPLLTRENQTVGNRYIVGRRLGEGGMGEVYRAVHIGIGRPFAIKFLHAHLARDEELVSRFQREAQSAGSLCDENIVSVTDFGVADDGSPYLVMELLDGDSLSSLLLRHGALPPARAAHIMLQVCRGLAHAHGKGIVHRDLKPENLIVVRRNDGSDLVKILDFGIAKLRTSAGLTKTGKTIGTPSYMSPEQTRGEKDVDPRTDVYSLGVILYEMVAGEKPFPGDDFFQIVNLVQNRQPPPLAELKPDLPRGFSEVVAKAMAREREDRFPSAVALLQALIPFVDGATTPPKAQEARVAAVRPAPVPTVVDGQRTTRPATATARVSRRRGWMWGVAGAILLTVVAIAAWLWADTQPDAAVPAALPSVAPEPAPSPRPAPASAEANAEAPTAIKEAKSPPAEVESAPAIAVPQPPAELQPARAVAGGAANRGEDGAKAVAKPDHDVRKRPSTPLPASPRRSPAVRELDRKNPFAD